MPAVHSIGCGKCISVKVDFEYSRYLSGILQPLVQELIVLCLSDFSAAFEHSCKGSWLRIILSSEIGAQSLSGGEQGICFRRFEIKIFPVTCDMVRCPGGVGHLIRYCLGMFSIDAFLYRLSFLIRNALRIQISKHFLHSLLNISSIRGKLLFQCPELILMEPQHDLNGAAHWDTPYSAAWQAFAYCRYWVRGNGYLCDGEDSTADWMNEDPGSKNQTFSSCLPPMS